MRDDYPFNGLEAAKLMGEEGKVMLNTREESWRVNSAGNFEQVINSRWVETPFQRKHMVMYWQQVSQDSLQQQVSNASWACEQLEGARTALRQASDYAVSPSCQRAITEALAELDLEIEQAQLTFLEWKQICQK